MQMRASRRWLTLAPAYTWLLIFGFAPLLIMLLFSFLSDVPLGRREVYFTLENYANFFERSLYQRLASNSFVIASLTTFGCVLLGYPLAFAIARQIRGRWRGALFLLVIIPFWTNSLIRLYSWYVLLQNEGVVPQFMRLFGVETGSMLFTLPTIIVGLVHAYLPYMVLTIYISLDRIDSSLIEASTSLGANPLRTFASVLFPLSLPGLISGVILVFIPSLGSFAEPRLLGGRQGNVLGTVIEDQFVEAFNWTQGAALSFVLLVMVLIAGLAAAYAVRVWRSL
jgi:spermidine/putrescine transport system permease protein